MKGKVLQRKLKTTKRPRVTSRLSTTTVRRIVTLLGMFWAEEGIPLILLTFLFALKHYFHDEIVDLGATKHETRGREGFIGYRWVPVDAQYLHQERTRKDVMYPHINLSLGQDVLWSFMISFMCHMFNIIFRH